MKIAKLAVVSVVILVAAALSGCKTTEVQAYRVLASTSIAVDAAMKSWAAYCATVPVTPEQHKEVERAYNAYLSGLQSCEIVVLGYKASKRGDVNAAMSQVVALATNVIQTIELVKQK